MVILINQLVESISTNKTKCYIRVWRSNLQSHTLLSRYCVVCGLHCSTVCLHPCPAPLPSPSLGFIGAVDQNLPIPLKTTPQMLAFRLHKSLECFPFCVRSRKTFYLSFTRGELEPFNEKPFVNVLDSMSSSI